MKRLKILQNITTSDKLFGYRQFFLQNGYLHLKNILPKKNLINLKRKLINFKKKTNNNKTLIFDFHKEVTSAYRIMDNDDIKNIAKSIFKTQKIHSIQIAFFSTPKNENGFPPHQDDFFLRSGYNNTINVWVPLIKIGPKNGTLSIYLNSHKKKINKKINILSLNEKNLKKINFLKKFSTKKMICNIGDVVFIHNNIFHKGGYNSSKSKRYILSFTYLKDKKSFFSGNTANRKKIKLN